MPSNRLEIRFLDILENIRRIRAYVQGMDQEAFDVDLRTRDVVERCLERVSEAATKLGEQADELAPGLPWKPVRAFGNVLRHAYDQVSSARIWEIVITDLPSMEDAAKAALLHLEKIAKP